MEKFRFRLFKAKVKDILALDLSRKLSEKTELLSEAISSQIKTKIANLETNDILQDSISQTIKDALLTWQSHREGNNSLVILANPVSPLTRILSDSLTDKLNNTLLDVESLSWQARLHNYSKIKTELLETVKPREKNNIAADHSSFENQNIIIIPRLEWCFLRCIGGLEAIYTLRDLVVNHPERFWLIGCNNWAWQYLENIFQISAYLNQSIDLPLLSDTQLKEWLTPIANEIEPLWLEDREWLKIKKKELKKAQRKKLILDEVQKVQERYYINLADISQGVATVAGDLWWRSLLVKETAEQKISYQIEKAKLPELPELVVTDLYLLYSLLLHGGMSLSHLALSMGKNQSAIKARTQYLLQTGVVSKEQEILTVNPAYYPKLRSTLSNNNFLVG
ncbi:MAG: hypothetical protein AAFQ80_08305 [Cyanobacteria bacterium J06621_8]